MTRYFFEILVEDTIPDPIGSDLADSEAARMYAIEVAESQLKDVDQVASDRTVRIFIKDEAGETIETVKSVWIESPALAEDVVD